MHAGATHEDSMPAWLHRSVTIPTECLVRVLVPIRCCRSLTRSSLRWVFQKNPGETTRLWTPRLLRARFPWTWLTWWSFSLACWRLEPLPNCPLACRGRVWSYILCNHTRCIHPALQSPWCKHTPAPVRTPGTGGSGSTSKTQECELLDHSNVCSV